MRSAFVLATTLTLIRCVAGCGNVTTGAAPGAPSAPDASIPATPGGPTGLPCDVNRILVDRCQPCHASTPQFGAPMPLVTREHLIAPATSDAAKKVYELVSTRIKYAAKPMPQPPNARLDAKQIATLDAWIARGAPISDGACEGAPLPDAGASDASTAPGLPGPLDCTPDISLTPKGEWTMPQATRDEYVCFGIDVTVPSKRQAVAFAPKIVNTKIVHHVLLFQTPSAVDPTHTPCGAGGGSGWRMMFGWAPGGQNLALPPEAGFPLEGTTHYAVQVHYSNIAGAIGEKDRSGFAICTTDKLRPNDADVMAFGTTTFTIPARATLDRTCDFVVPNGINDVRLIASLPHMHKIGKSIEVTQLVAGGDGGTPIDLGHQATWNFDNQVWFGINATVRAGDTIRTRCAWTNPTDKAVGFGEKTEDEMCYSFTMYYPKVNLGVWNWQIPAYASTCRDTR